MKKRFILLVSTLGVLGISAMAFAAGTSPAVVTNLEKLGMHLYNDKNISINTNQSCRTCHHHLAGFADLKNHLHPYTSVVSTGSDGVSKGGRNAPTSAYAGYSPVLSLVDGEWEGGLFWDGRADGSILGDPLAEQAQGPPLNPVEMAMEDESAVIAVIQASDYVKLWYKEFGPNSLDDVDEAFDNFARALAAYERSEDVTKFNSRFDTDATFIPAEDRGLALFETNCAQCHSTTVAFDAPAPLFTNYRYANIGVPTNPLVPVPTGGDLGLGITVNDDAQDGKFKVPTLRNIAMSAPYSHNGNFPTLEAMVSFINDSSGFNPEVNRNIDSRVGNIGLTDADIQDIIAFLNTLTDDY